MKTIICSYILLLATILFGCDSNCCDCDGEAITNDGSGNLHLIRSSDKLWEGMNDIENLDVYFYNSLQSTQYQRIYNDTTRLFMADGEYTVLAINSVANITGLESYRTAKVSIPVWSLNGENITSNVPMTVATYATAFVDESENSKCVISPYPIVYIINFRFQISTDSLVGDIKQIKAELHGVKTSKMLFHDNNSSDNSLATLQLTANERDKNIFDNRVSILGLSNQDNYLDVFIECEDGTIKNASIDLTNLFDFSLSPIQNCVIDMSVNTERVSAQINNVLIKDWEEGVDGNIEL